MEKKAVKKAIAALLQRNARISDGEIADRLELKPEQVKKIIGDMEQDRTIFGYSALLNEEKLGDGKVRAIIEVSIQPERDSGYERVAREISNSLKCERSTWFPAGTIWVWKWRAFRSRKWRFSLPANWLPWTASGLRSRISC